MHTVLERLPPVEGGVLDDLASEGFTEMTCDEARRMVAGMPPLARRNFAAWFGRDCRLRGEGTP